MKRQFSIIFQSYSIREFGILLHALSKNAFFIFKALYFSRFNLDIHGQGMII